jgi:hypothetical protein
MSLIGLQTYIVFKIKFLLPKHDFFFMSVLIGLIIPEIDIIIIYIYNLLSSNQNNIFLFNKNFINSMIVLGVIHFSFLVIYEITKDNKVLNIGKGIVLGMIINTLVDLIFRFRNIDVFWPLPIGTIKNLEYPTLILGIFMSLEFIFFRLIASELIKAILDNPSKTKNDKFIKQLSFWMKIESLYFIIFILIVFLLKELQIKLFLILYIISYLMLALSIFKARKSIK